MRTSSTAARPASASRKSASEAGVAARPSGGVGPMRTGYMAIGLALVVAVVPASFAQAPKVVGHGKSAGTAIEAEQRQAQQRLGSDTGISLAVPIGRVSVGPEVEDGEPIYVRRTTV